MEALPQENLHRLQMLHNDAEDIFADDQKKIYMDNKEGISHNKTCASELTANTSVQTTLSKKRNGLKMDKKTQVKNLVDEQQAPIKKRQIKAKDKNSLSRIEQVLKNIAQTDQMDDNDTNYVSNANHFDYLNDFRDFEDDQKLQSISVPNKISKKDHGYLKTASIKHHNLEEIQTKISNDIPLMLKLKTCTVSLSERNISNDFKNNWLQLDEQKPLMKQIIKPEDMVVVPNAVPTYNDKYVFDQVTTNMYNQFPAFNMNHNLYQENIPMGYNHNQRYTVMPQYFAQNDSQLFSNQPQYYVQDNFKYNQKFDEYEIPFTAQQGFINRPEISQEQKSPKKLAKYQQIFKVPSSDESTNIKSEFSNNSDLDSDPKVLQTIRKLGEGLQSKVYAAYYQSNKDDIKCLKVFQPFKNEKGKRNAANEYAIGEKLLGHQNIVEMYNYHKETEVVIDGKKGEHNFLEIEYCKNGDLYDFMRSYTNYHSSIRSFSKGLLYNDIGLLRQLYIQLINALDSLHNQIGYAHMDIKLENVLISTKGYLKLGDFGFSTPDKTIQKIVGTPAYMAPEIHQARQKAFEAKKSDLFSLGVLFYILAFGAPPFHKAIETDDFYKNLKRNNGKYSYFQKHHHSKKLYEEGLLSTAFMDLILGLLNTNPADRIKNINELRKNPFILGSDPNFLFKRAYLMDSQQAADGLVQLRTFVKTRSQI